MKERLIIGFSIIFGKSLIIYEENSKEIVAMIGGKENILKKGLNFALDKYVTENNAKIRYLGSDKE